MDLNEFIPEEERQGIIDYYTFKIGELEQKVAYYKSLLTKLDGNKPEVNDAIVTVSSRIEDDIKITPFYAPDDVEVKKKIPRQNWKFLCITALNKLDGLSTSHELYDYITKDKSELLEYDKTAIISKISTALSNLFTKDKVKRIKNSIGRGYFWALPAWFDGEDVKPLYKELLLEKYEVDEASLFGEY